MIKSVRPSTTGKLPIEVVELLVSEWFSTESLGAMVSFLFFTDNFFTQDFFPFLRTVTVDGIAIMTSCELYKQCEFL